MSNRCIDHGALAQYQVTVVDKLQNSARKFMFFPQAAEVKDRGFIESAL